MNNILPVLLITAIFLLSGCEKKKTIDSNVTLEKNESTDQVKVLNPNMASVDQMRLIVSKELAQLIEDKRPFLSTANFISFLNNSLSKEEIKAVSEKMFLPINLNIATESEILSVPGVGKKIAHEFDEYRPYKNIVQFRREIGKYVDEKQVAVYERYVFVPINLNTATKDEILAIPGIGKKMLHEFEEYRPYQSMAHFRREIGKYVDDQELNRLQRYVTL